MNNPKTHSTAIVTDNAKNAAKNAIEAQLVDWGISAEDDNNLWRHLSGNSAASINIYLSAGKVGEDRLRSGGQTNLEAEGLNIEQVLEHCPQIVEAVKSNWKMNEVVETPILGISNITKLSTLLGGVLVKIGAKAAIEAIDSEKGKTMSGGMSR